MLGASFDPVDANLKFADEHQFPYPLLSDLDHEVGPAYGVEQEGDKRQFARRHTFLIGPDGRLAKTYEVTDFAGHPEEVIADIRELQASQG